MSEVLPELVVLANEEGLRLDVWVAQRVPELSRRAAQKMLEAMGIAVNGRPARKGQRVNRGDVVRFLAPPAPSDFAPRPDETVPLVIVYEDDDLLVVDKPARVPCHPLRHDELGTLANALVVRSPELLMIGHKMRECGLVHRLDTETSGLVLVAKNHEAFAALTEALDEGAIDKRYLAYVAEAPTPMPMVIDTPLENDPADARRMRASYDGRPATTELLRARSQGAVVELEVRAPHATRHQVRVHLAHVGAPLLGDRLYGGPSVPGLARHALHASSIELVHPRTGARHRFEAKPPDDLRALGR